MADELDDGEFWLPSHFLDNDDLLTTACPFHSKTVILLSTSPQSTLFGCDCNLQGSGSGSGSGSTSSHGSPTKNDNDNDNDDKGRDNNTLELLNKAAGEVAKMKLKNERTIKSSGTGFFDCSRTINKQLSSSTSQPPLRPPKPSVYPPSVYFPQFPPVMMWGPAQSAPPPQHQKTRGTTNNSSNNNNNKNNTKDDNNNNNNNNNSSKSSSRPLGLSTAAWPLLPGQVQVQTQATSMFVVPPRESVGTGVFLPRRGGSPPEPKKKPDKNTTKTKNNKGSQQQSVHSIKTNVDEIQLPPEWVY